MRKIFIATGNAHKISEFREIFDTLGLEAELVSPKDFNDDSEPVENGSTYKENSYIKARFYYDKYHLPTLADDSGIEIDFFDGQPGIHSARFLPGMSYPERNDYICDKMKDSDNRGASFHCVVTYIDEKGEARFHEGVVKGSIAREPKGIEGFGYDPIFITDGYDKTNALMGQEFKNSHSHRAIALRKWVEDLED